MIIKAQYQRIHSERVRGSSLYGSGRQECNLNRGNNPTCEH